MLAPPTAAGGTLRWMVGSLDAKGKGDEMKMCFNWKVLAGLGAVAVAIFIVNPQLVVGALPLLLFAACPLSCVFMVVGMGKMGHQEAQPIGQAEAAAQYTCPMHPEVRSDHPGRCPKCGMNLVVVRSKSASITGPTTREDELAQLRARLQEINAQQAALARQVEELEVKGEPLQPHTALVEAERVAQAADRRP